MEILQILREYWGTILLGIVAFVGLILILKNLEAIRGFIREVTVELRKASWPWEPKEKGFKKYKELVDSTMIVVIAMLLMAGYVAFWDFMMVNLVSFLTQ